MTFETSQDRKFRDPRTMEDVNHGWTGPNLPSSAPDVRAIADDDPQAPRPLLTRAKPSTHPEERRDHSDSRARLVVDARPPARPDEWTPTAPTTAVLRMREHEDRVEATFNRWWTPEVHHGIDAGVAHRMAAAVQRGLEAAEARATHDVDALVERSLRAAEARVTHDVDALVQRGLQAAEAGVTHDVDALVQRGLQAAEAGVTHDIDALVQRGLQAAGPRIDETVKSHVDAAVTNFGAASKVNAADAEWSKYQEDLVARLKARSAEAQEKRLQEIRDEADDADDAATRDESADDDAAADDTARVDAAVASTPSPPNGEVASASPPPDGEGKRGGDDKSPSDGKDGGNGASAWGDDNNLPPSVEAPGGGNNDEGSDPPDGLVMENGPPWTPPDGTGGNYAIYPPEGKAGGNGAYVWGGDENFSPSDGMGGNDEISPPDGKPGEDEPPLYPSRGTRGNNGLSPPDGKVGEMELSPPDGKVGEMELSPADGKVGEMELSPSDGKVGEMELYPADGKVGDMRQGASGEAPGVETLPPPDEKVGGKGSERGEPPDPGPPARTPYRAGTVGVVLPPSEAGENEVRGAATLTCGSDYRFAGALKVPKQRGAKDPGGISPEPRPAPQSRDSNRPEGRHRKPPDPGPTTMTPFRLPREKDGAGRRYGATTQVRGKENEAPRRNVEWVLAPDWTCESDDDPCGRAPAGYKSQPGVIHGVTVPRLFHVRVEQEGGDKDPPWVGPDDDRGPDPPWDCADSRNNSRETRVREWHGGSDNVKNSGYDRDRSDAGYDTDGYDSCGHEDGHSGETCDADIVGESYGGVYLGGYSDGHTDGYEDGYENGYDYGYYDDEVSDDGQDSWSDYS